MNENGDDRLSFGTSAPVDEIVVENKLLEDELSVQDALAASYECNRVAANWIAYKVTLKKKWEKII